MLKYLAIAPLVAKSDIRKDNVIILIKLVFINLLRR